MWITVRETILSKSNQKVLKKSLEDRPERYLGRNPGIKSYFAVLVYARRCQNHGLCAQILSVVVFVGLFPISKQIYLGISRYAFTIYLG